jgi:hypothetical protein
MAKYATAVVDALHTTFSAQMATEIAAVEADNGLTAGDMPAIRDYFKYRALNEHVSPSLSISCYETAFLEQSLKHAVCRCTVALRYAGDADVEATELLMRRYATAMISVVTNNNEMGADKIHTTFVDEVSFSEVYLDGAAFVDVVMGLSVDIEE